MAHKKAGHKKNNFEARRKAVEYYLLYEELVKTYGHLWNSSGFAWNLQTHQSVGDWTTGFELKVLNQRVTDCNCMCIQKWIL